MDTENIFEDFQRPVSPLACGYSWCRARKICGTKQRDWLVTVMVAGLSYFRRLRSDDYKYRYPYPVTTILQNDFPDLAAAFYCIDIKFPDRLYGFRG